MSDLALYLPLPDHWSAGTASILAERLFREELPDDVPVQLLEMSADADEPIIVRQWSHAT